MPETSIIIRTKNESKWIGENLKILKEQTYKDFEIIVIDSGSTDGTLEIVKKFGVNLFEIKPEEFSYPFALNYGCKKSSAEKYFVFISGHSLPISKTWLADGLENFSDSNTMGVFGFVWALPEGSFLEKIIFNKYICKLRNLFKPKIIFKRDQMGVMGFTNAIIRRDLWEKHNFDENYGAGGEDGEWARHWFNLGFNAIRDIRFSVYHSHGLNLGQLKKQWQYWESLGAPRPFNIKELDYRSKK